MKTIRRMYNRYVPFTRSVLQKKMSYKFDFVMAIIGQLVKCFVIYFLWKAVYVNSDSAVMNGFTANDIILYVFMSTITINIVNNTVDAAIGNEVWDGTIAMNLIKPVNYQTRLFFESFAELFQGTVFIALPIWMGLVVVRFFTLAELPPSIFTVILYLLSAFLGFVILFLINFSFGILSFYVTNIWGIRNLKYAIMDFLSGVIIPIAFLPMWLQKILDFVPFSSISYFPVLIYLGKVTGSGIVFTLVLQVIWIGILYLISILLWNKATRRLTILGG